MTAHHEGKLLLAVLTKHGRTQQDLATALKIYSSAVTRYVQATTIQDRSWLRVREGLQRLGIDPAEIRPEPVVMSRERTAPGIALQRLSAVHEESRS